MRKNYLLILYINDFCEMGGGFEIHTFDTIAEMEDAINERLKDERASVNMACVVDEWYDAEAVEKITKYQLKSK